MIRVIFLKVGRAGRIIAVPDQCQSTRSYQASIFKTAVDQYVVQVNSKLKPFVMSPFVVFLSQQSTSSDMIEPQNIFTG